MTGPAFGYCLPIFANPSAGLFRTPNLEQVNARECLDLGTLAERLGFDSLWVADHLMLGRDEAVLEGWTMLSALAGVTSRARLGMIHQGHFFRHPGMTANMAATLDQLSDGRFIMFYDPGHQEREHRAYRLAFPEDADRRVRDTLDGLRLIRDLWQANQPITASHGAFGVTNATCAPGPAQRPHPPIWFGETHPGLLAACAEFGHGWNTIPCGIDEFRSRVGLLHEACAKIGRDSADIEVSIELQVLTAPADEARTVLGAILDKAPNQGAIDPELRAYTNGVRERPPSSFTDTTLIGSADEIAAGLRKYAASGASHFLLWFLDAPDRAGMENFARHVIPRFQGR